MNNGIFAQDVYGKPGFSSSLPQPLTGPPNVVQMPYHSPPGREWSINTKNWTVVIDTTLDNNTNVTMSFNISGSTLIDIDWGDGYFESFLLGGSRDISHSYSCHGIYTIQLYFSIIGNSGIGSDTVTNRVKWVKCSSLGDKGIPRCRQMFNGCSNLVEVPKTIPSGCGAGTDGMRAMFANATKFNGDISSWDVSSCISMQQMFATASNFNQPLNNWNVRKVTNFSEMFAGAANFNSSLSGWTLGADVSNVNCNQMFRYASVFNQDIGNWDVSKVNDMRFMFQGATSFNNAGSSGINNWNTSSLTNMQQMFVNATTFNQPLNNWNVRKVTTFASMFQGATSFNSSLSGWSPGLDVIGTVTLYAMFQQASSFNQPLSSWDVSNVTNMQQMFALAGNFNQSLDNWNVRKVTNFSSMFNGATSFNSSLSGWALGADTAGTTCEAMFISATNFTGSGLDSWDTSKVNSMRNMLRQSAFNANISGWNVSNVTNMENMFYFTGPFNQDISSWNLAGLNVNSALDNFMTGKTGATALSTANYDALLIGWNNNKASGVNGVANWRTDLKPSFGGAKYTSGGDAATARAALVTYGWTITDGGVA